MKVLSKYCRVLWACFKASLQADLEFRVNLGFKVITDVIWYATQVVTFAVLFSHTPTIGGWNYEQMRIFLGILFVVDGIFMTIFGENIDTFSEKVQKGELDLLLTKPINAQVLISCQRIATSSLANLGLGFAWLIYALTSYSQPLPLGALLMLFVLIPNGVMIFYAFRFSFALTAIIFTRAENLQYLWYQIYRLATRPDSFYPTWLRYAVLFVIPMGLVASVPARALFEATSLWQPLWALAFGFGMVFLSHLLWKRVIIRYGSASS